MCKLLDACCSLGAQCVVNISLKCTPLWAYGGDKSGTFTEVKVAIPLELKLKTGKLKT